ncbi:MAG: type II toxin-antitoxin system VapC family toxin [Ornithinimicrobium sp.]|uniref:type II toxin-antitoxin system VapC family toxin n=1 Tax=Ornithinimicrobium sp. TaxID=1977084 RepID=UPI003D9BCD8B
MILVDTSVWVDYLRGASTRPVGELHRLVRVDPGVLATCEPIAMELLAGAGPAQLASVERLVDGLVSLETHPATHYRHAAAIYRAVRADGHTVRAVNDCLIAAVAVTHDAAILHRDKDFERIAACTTLQVHHPQ